MVAIMGHRTALFGHVRSLISAANYDNLYRILGQVLVTHEKAPKLKAQLFNCTRININIAIFIFKFKVGLRYFRSLIPKSLYHSASSSTLVCSLNIMSRTI
jgi:hypothetical protein